MMGIGVVILPFFVVATMMKIGNYGNDGRKLGAKKGQQTNTGISNSILRDAIYENLGGLNLDASGAMGSGQSAAARKRFRFFRLVWRHSMPTGALLHALAALCFLVPRILMEAQLISYGFLQKG